MESESVPSENKEIINKIQQKVDCPSIVMITDGRGNILDCNIANSIGKIVELSELTYIATTIALSLEITSLHRILGGLELDVRIFKDVFALTTLFGKDRLLIVLVPRTINLDKTIKSVTEIIKPRIEKVKAQLESER